MHKPKLKILQDFTKIYFHRRYPVVRWKKMDYMGQAILKDHIIYLNPEETPGFNGGCDIGDSMSFHPRRFKIQTGEQYFLTLLHEIGHFKIRNVTPSNKKFYSIYRKVKKEYPDDPDTQMYVAEEYFSSYDEYIKFRMWRSGGLAHTAVEKWAIDEFKKKRKLISRLLRYET